MKYLVTGGTGFIGSALVKALLRSGGTVRSLDNDSRGSRRKLGEAADDVELVVGDIRDADAVRRATKGVDCVCHLAYVNGTEFFYTRPDFILDVAVKGMINVLDACLAEGVGDLVLASSSEAYQTPQVVPTPEEVPLVVPDVQNPRYSYGGGKIICELMAVNYGRERFRRVAIFRPHNVYGPDMGFEHVIPQFGMRMRDLCAAQPEGTVRFPIQGSGRETRSFVYVDDAADGILRIIQQGTHLGIYHVGTEDEVTVAHLAGLVGRHFGRDVEIVPGELQKGGTPRRCPDVAKLRALGFAPRFSLEQGLAQTLPWYADARNAPSRR